MTLQGDQLHPPRDPQPAKWLKLAGLYGLIAAGKDQTPTMRRYCSYNQIKEVDKRMVVGLYIQTLMQGQTDPYIKAVAVEEVEDLAERYGFTQGELQKMALEVKRGTELDEDFWADNGARDLARKIDEHVTRWFLQPGTSVGEVVADDRFFGYDGHEKILESVRSSPRNDDRYDAVFRALLDNYWGAEVEERRLNPDDLPEELKLPPQRRRDQHLVVDRAQGRAGHDPGRDRDLKIPPYPFNHTCTPTPIIRRKNHI